MRLRTSGPAAAFVIVIALSGRATSLGSEDRPPAALYPMILLKPGESGHLDLAAPHSTIGALDRTTYAAEPINEAGEKATALKGVEVKEDRDRMGSLMNQTKSRCVSMRVSASADAEAGATLMRIRAHGFGGGQYAIVVKVVITSCTG